MKLTTLLFAALLGLMSSAAFAANPPPPAATGAGPQGDHMNRCEKNQAECKADAAKFDQWCSANADKCLNFKSWAEKHIEFCQKNSQKCQEMHQKMRERHEERCKQDANNPHCKGMKSDEPGDQNQGDEPGNDQMPPPPPAGF